MVAETLTSTRASSTFPVAGNGPAGDLKLAWGTYAIAANVEDGDIFEMCRVPAGATVVGGYLLAGDMDTGTEALDLDLGWAANGSDAADPDGLGNFGVSTGDTSVHLGGTGIFLPFQGVLMTAGPKTFAAETVIQIEANAAAATFAAGQVTVLVFYTV
jgi:hypothetical protein